MKIVFKRSEIINSISPLMCAVSGKSTLTAVDGILIEAKKPDVCTFTTFDIEKGIRITVYAEVEEEGYFIINAQKFNQTVKVMDGEYITLTVDEKLCATFECGRSSHKTGALRGEEFPEIPRLTSEKGFVISQAILKKMLSKVGYAMAVNDPRPVLNGCYIRTADNELSLVTCDTFKLAVCSCKTDLTKLENSEKGADFSFIVPSKSVNELVKLLSDDEDDKATVYMSHKNIVIDLGDIIFFSRLITGEYMDYDRVIIKNHKIFMTVDKMRLISALEKASLITEEKIAGSVRANVKLELEDSLIKISAVSSAGSMYDEVEIEHEGDDLTIAFNNRFLIDSIRACSADKIKIAMSSKLMSINIQPAEASDEFSELFMLLPVRTKD